MYTDNWRGRGAWRRLAGEADFESLVGHKASEWTKRWFPQILNLGLSAFICGIGFSSLFASIRVHSRFYFVFVRGPHSRLI
jgi:hypothetical protein